MTLKNSTNKRETKYLALGFTFCLAIVLAAIVYGISKHGRDYVIGVFSMLVLVAGPFFICYKLLAEDRKSDSNECPWMRRNKLPWDAYESSKKSWKQKE